MRMRTVNGLLMRRPKGVEEGLPGREIAVNGALPDSCLLRDGRKIQVRKARVLKTACNGIKDQFDSGCLLPGS